MITNNKDNQIKFKTSILGSSLCGYNNAYTLIKRTIKVENKGAQGHLNNAANKRQYLKIVCHLLTQVNDAHLLTH